MSCVCFRIQPSVRFCRNMASIPDTEEKDSIFMGDKLRIGRRRRPWAERVYRIGMIVGQLSKRSLRKYLYLDITTVFNIRTASDTTWCTDHDVESRQDRRHDCPRPIHSLSLDIISMLREESVLASMLATFSGLGIRVHKLSIATALPGVGLGFDCV